MMTRLAGGGGAGAKAGGKIADGCQPDAVGLGVALGIGDNVSTGIGEHERRERLLLRIR